MFGLGSIASLAGGLFGGSGSGGGSAAPAGPSAGGGRGGDVFNAGSVFGQVLNNANATGGAGGSAASGNAGNGANQAAGLSNWIWIAAAGLAVLALGLWFFKRK
jgi:LPXTG-motif cell wall-anchored protein